MAKTKILRHKSGLRVELDRSQVFPDNPGLGTPEMVYMCGHLKCGSTLTCAQDTGELIGSAADESDSYHLTPEQQDWLQSIDKEVEDFLYK